MPSTVYFADMRSGPKRSLPAKVAEIMQKLRFFENITKGDLVAIKTHFGEPGNTGYIRPVFFRPLGEAIRAKGGNPFMMDSNTLYRGGRSNAVDSLNSALRNGFGFASVGMPVIIADGLAGKDYVEVAVGGKHFDKVKIASAAYFADAMLVTTHTKGHPFFGLGGAIKNLCMGLASRSGKQTMHADVKPQADPNKCIACGQCIEFCPVDAISFKEVGGKKVAVTDLEVCIGCGECITTCPVGAVAIDWSGQPRSVQEKGVEYALGAVKSFKPGKVGFINFITDVSPDCDCCGWSDAPVIQDVGFLAGDDPVAIDQASLDLINEQPPLPGTALSDKESAKDKFKALFPKADAQVQLAYAEELKLGSRKYDLVKLQ